MLIAAAAAAKPGDLKSTGNYLSPASPALTRSPLMQCTSNGLPSPNPQMYWAQNNPSRNLQAGNNGNIYCVGPLLIIILSKSS